MPRQPRLNAPGVLHHVMGRGIEGIKIFRSNTDQEDSLTSLEALCKNEVWKIYALALLDNHFHLPARTGKEPVSVNMRETPDRYSTGLTVGEHAQTGSP
ncbi:MAG: transposase [Deltaproteobacteria bacterium]|nr:transposase [Deltaproteobacteria bacterium]